MKFNQKIELFYLDELYTLIKNNSRTVCGQSLTISTAGLQVMNCTTVLNGKKLSPSSRCEYIYIVKYIDDIAESVITHIFFCLLLVSGDHNQ